MIHALTRKRLLESLCVGWQSCSQFLPDLFYCMSTHYSTGKPTAEKGPHFMTINNFGAAHNSSLVT